MSIFDSFNILNSFTKNSVFKFRSFYLLKRLLSSISNYKINTPNLYFNPAKLLQSNINNVYKDPNLMECSALDDLRREQLNKIIGKVGVKKRDAGMYWKQYKTKRIKIKKRKRKRGMNRVLKWCIARII
ncbi:uncharacterized protein TA19120 [Theileria annulata]|uniref:Uncharacterized protein n=1 Tax=Theileria annulata TaxID=5874 RepID=Q4UGA1_THEAN|nr:uncharacterized protein TA19120 [Theileria annulata]CAI73888.1 hypothetical protein TA19120 [Theileria annulata]|eukprot:XP_954565.1 hypothetical protein TA19120 [Theileria annulata]